MLGDELSIDDYKVGFKAIIKELRKLVMKPKISRKSVQEIIDLFSTYNIEI
jgi:hypothetical protein